MSFCCHIALARTLITVCIDMESGLPCLVPDFNWTTLSSSPLNLILAVVLLYVAFIMFSYVLVSFLALSKISIMKGY